jgi:CCR4-NOT complex subunit CAF16
MTVDTALAAIDCQNLTFAWKDGIDPVLENINLELQRGDRCLLIGANGGK